MLTVVNLQLVSTWNRYCEVDRVAWRSRFLSNRGSDSRWLHTGLVRLPDGFGLWTLSYRLGTAECRYTMVEILKNVAFTKFGY